MRALLLIVEVVKPADALAFRDVVVEELLGYRLLITCAGAPGALELPPALLSKCQAVQLVSFGLNLSDLDVSDKSVKELLRRMRLGKQVVEGPYGQVSALHLAAAEIGREGLASMQELLMSQTCALSSLDLSRTQVDGWTLVQALRGNSSLTSLDVRRVPSIGNVLQQMGDMLLQKGGICRIGYVRCDAYEVLEGEKVLNLREHELSSGAARLLAGLLKHNPELTDVDLSATDLEPDGADALASALEFNSALTALRMAYNPALDTAVKDNLRAAADRWKPNLRLDL